jgi:four helix bundle protein
MSIPSNVAEGFSRHSTPSYVQHLWIAHASGAELETQLELGRRIGLIEDRIAETLIADTREVGRIINGLVRSLERAPNNIPWASALTTGAYRLIPGLTLRPGA